MTYAILFHMAFFCAALLVSLTSIFFTHFQKRTDLPHNQLFLLMNYFVLFNSITCICTEMFETLSRYYQVFYIPLLVSQFTYFLIHNALAPALFFYVMTVSGTFTASKHILKYLCLIPFVLTEILVITNPLHHLVYFYDANMHFNRNWAESIIYIMSILYVVTAFLNLMLSWNALRRRNRYALIYFFCLTLFGVIIQYFFIDIKSELFCEALALTGLMLSVENEEDRLDSETGVYNRSALKMDVNHLLAKKYSMNIVCLKITNIDMISQLTGVSNSDEIIREISNFLKTIVPRYCIYHTDLNTLVILLKHDKYSSKNPDPHSIAESIHNRFQADWAIHGVSIKLNTVVMTASVPSHIHTLANLLYMIESPVPKEMENTILNDEDLEFLIRRAAVESAISNGLPNGNFEVYYQPTYCMDGLKLHGAEALIRLHDDVIGDVYPDEFIPIAEQTGYIDDIDDFVLNQVCAFIKSGEPLKLGMDCINVNLSVLQCMRADFVPRILSIVESYDIPKAFINFEITESVSANDYELLSDVVKQLKENGFQFSMDDYGTGYSNMHSLFSLDFDIVKIDKSILWDSEKSDRGQIILENCVHMIKQMQRKILVEGVETKTHVDKLKTLGVDYLQGYYFSRPITKKELRAHCSSR